MKIALRVVLYVLGGLIILAGVVGSISQGDTSMNVVA
jgi:hypothetical protein